MENQNLIYRIFISSTNDLREYRKIARNCVYAQGHLPIEEDKLHIANISPEESIKNLIRGSDLVLILAGYRYGSKSDEKTSYVRFEYETAVSEGKPVNVLIFEDLKNVLGREREQAEFIDELMKKRLCKKFWNDVTIANEVHKMLGNIHKDMATHPELGLVEHSYLISRLNKELENANNERRLLEKRLLKLERENLKVKGKERIVERKQEIGNKLERLVEAMNKFVGDAKWITRDWEAGEVLLSFIEWKIDRIRHDLKNLIDPKGYRPASVEELIVWIESLFSDTLSTLCATSINSKEPSLQSFNAYWEHPEISPVFEKRNTEFLKRGGTICRIFYCDSIVKCVKERWFAEVVMKQLAENVRAKVEEIDRVKISDYEDFGVYEHKIGDSDEGSYVLLAPRIQRMDTSLDTTIISDPNRVSEFRAAFDFSWEKTEELQIISPPPCNIKDQVYGDGKVNDLFQNRIVLRNMVRLDTGEKLLRADYGFVRKFEEPYAEAISRHLQKKEFSGCNGCLYFGDTSDNDGGVIRNLQAMGIDISGFICDPSLKLNNLWFNKLYFSSKWTDVLGFLQVVKEKIMENPVIIFDIDQTLWAPKGLHEKPLSSARMAGISELIDRYVSAENDIFSSFAKNKAEKIYKAISNPSFNEVTKDNEDYKAAITVALALGFYRRGIKEDALVKFEQMHLPDILERYYSDGGMTEFLIDVLTEAILRPIAEPYIKRNGIKIREFEHDLRYLQSNIEDKVPAPFTTFRLSEFKETLDRAQNPDLPIDHRITLTKRCGT